MARKDYVGIYKPRKAITGGAVAQFKIGAQRDCMFLELAKQTQPMNSSEPYDWKNTKITVKLGAADIGKLIALFSGCLPMESDPNKPDLELYHKNAKGNKVIKIKKQDRGYYLKASVQEGSRQDAVAIPISWDETELVLIALKRGFEIMLGW